MSFIRVGSLVWPAGAFLIALPIAVPIVMVLLTLLSPPSDVWLHLRETVLTDYLRNTLNLLVMVAFITAVVGVSTAWLTATRDFPGRDLLRWLLVLPLAAPAYVVAYAYADLLEFAGPVQSALRELTGWSAREYTFPAIRSLPGAAMVLGFVLYPYVYLLSYTAFAQQSAVLNEAARSLGASSRRAFFRIALPVARPAIAGGLALALMETAADYGVVDFFGVPTFTSGIFRTWFALGEHAAAVQLAAWLFVIVAVLVVIEQLARRGRVANSLARPAPAMLIPLRGATGWLAGFVCAVPVLIGFLIPMATLTVQAVTVGDPMFGRSFSDYVSNSVLVGISAAALATAAAIWLCYTVRLRPSLPVKVSLRIATLGYALPGMVLAVGLIVPLTSLDKWLAGVLFRELDLRVGLLLTGSVAALVFVYIARFLTVAFNSCEAGMARIHPQLDAAGRALGAHPGRLLTAVHLPLLMPAILTAVLLVFIDVVKELPATLVLRPFNFETLATRAYRLASDERLAEASTAALSIVAVGLIPCLLLSRQTFRLNRSD
jgi:iron(III) transport system permease protein